MQAKVVEGFDQPDQWSIPLLGALRSFSLFFFPFFWILERKATFFFLFKSVGKEATRPRKHLGRTAGGGRIIKKKNVPMIFANFNLYPMNYPVIHLNTLFVENFEN